MTTLPTPTPPAAPAPTFVCPVLNASGKTIPGSLPVHFVYMQDLWADGQDRTKLPPLAQIQAAAKSWPAGQPIRIDYEPPAPFGCVKPVWYDPASTSAQCRANIAQARELILMCRDARLDLRDNIELWGWTVSDDYGGEADPNRIEREISDIFATQALDPIAKLAHRIVIASYQNGAPDADYYAHTMRLIYRARGRGEPVELWVDTAANPAIVRKLAQACDFVGVWDYDPQNLHAAWVQPFIAAMSISS